MKKLYTFFSLTMAALLLFTTSCEDESLQRIPDIEANIGAITLITVNPEKTFYNAFDPLASQEVEFTLNVDGFEVTEVNSVDILLTFTENDATVDAEGNPADVVYDPVFIKTVGTFPETVAVSAQECADALGVEVSMFEVGDLFNLTFPINTADGRRLTTALNSDLCQEPVQPSFGGCNVQWAVACPSDADAITGTYTAVSSGTTTDPGPLINNPAVDIEKTVTITEVSPGVYEVSDILTGLYEFWYGAQYGFEGDTPNQFADVCSDISFSFTEPYGTTLTGTGTIDTEAGTIEWTWVNEWGDEATSVVLTKQ